MVTRAGWKRSPATIEPRSAGPRKGCAKRTMSCPGSAECSRRTPTACTSFSRAWRSARPSASPCRNIPPTTPIIASSPTSGVASPTTNFYIHDEVLGPIVMRVASFFPFRTTYFLNGHNFIEHQLRHRKIGFRKNDNAFVAVDDVAVLQAAADKLSPDIIRKTVGLLDLHPRPEILRQGAQ